MLIKICGITAPEIAIDCFETGADMIGLVHYPASPRHVDAAKIRKILDAAKPYRDKGRKVVLVVVDSLPEELLSRFDYVQCYGSVPQNISCKTITVVTDRKQYDELMSEPNNDEQQDLLFTLEMSRGILPGGNGTAWNWCEARPFCKRYPTLLAGGVTPENVIDAIQEAQPYGIDVSSGVESVRGIKDVNKVRHLIKTVRKYQAQHTAVK